MASIWDPTAGGSTVNANDTLRRQRFIATQGQTSFVLTEFSYVPGTGSTIIFYNGELQSVPQNYVESSATSIQLNFSCNAEDVVDVMAFTGVSATVQSIRLFNNSVVASAGQTQISTAATYRAGTSSTAIYRNGVRLVPVTQYTETDGASYVTLITPATGGETYFTVVGQLVNDVGSDAGLISYTPSGTGAVATTVESKLRQVINAKDFGAGATKTEAENKTALQAAITQAGIAGGVVYVDYDCNYGCDTRDPTTWPSFVGINKPVLVIDYSEGNSYDPTVFPVAYDGMQARHWYHTPQTTTLGGHDGNYMYARSDWNPGFFATNDSDLTGARHPLDNRRAGFSLGWLGNVAWQILQGTRIGASLTNEELGNLVIEKFAVDGDTLGDYAVYLVERKTGRISYSGGRNLPAAYHHFEPILGGTSAEIMLVESAATTSSVRLRNINGATSSGSSGAEDVTLQNVSGNAVIRLAVGAAVEVDKTTRRTRVFKAFQRSKVTMTYSASMTPNADEANIHQVFVTNGSAFTINNPTFSGDIVGQELTIRISNYGSGGALGAVTWGSAYKLSAWTQPADNFNRSITFFYDDSTAAWVEISRTPADVPN